MPELTRDEFLQNPSEWAEQLLWWIPPGWFRRAWVNPKFKESFLGSDHDWDHMHLTNDYFLPYRSFRFLQYLSANDIPELYKLVRNRLKLSEFIWRRRFIEVFLNADFLLPPIESPVTETDFLKEPIKVWQLAPRLVHPDWFVKAWRRADFHIYYRPGEIFRSGSLFRNYVLSEYELAYTLSITGRLHVKGHLLACLNALSIKELVGVYQDLQDNFGWVDEDWRSDFEALFPQTILSLPPVSEPPSKEEFFSFLEQKHTEIEWSTISNLLKFPIPWFVEAWADEEARSYVYDSFFYDCTRWLSKTGDLQLPFTAVACFNMLPATEVVDLYKQIRDHSHRLESEWRPAFEKYFPAAVEFLPEIQEEIPPDDVPEESIYQLDLGDPEVLDLPEHRPWDESQFSSEDDIPF